MDSLGFWMVLVEWLPLNIWAESLEVVCSLTIRPFCLLGICSRLTVCLIFKRDWKLHLLNFNGTTPTLSPRFVISRNIVDWWNHDPPLFFPLVSVHFLKLVQILPITMYSDWIYLPFEFGINWSGYAAKVRLANNKLPGLNGFHYSPERRALVSLVIYRYIGHHAVTQPQTTAVCVCVGY
jgi:hypothetical protein